MKIGAPRETAADEARVAMTPQGARDMLELGYDCLIGTGAGDTAGFDDASYRQEGVEVVCGTMLWK